EDLAQVDAPQGPGAATARFTAIDPDDGADEAGLRYARACDATIIAMPRKQTATAAAIFAERILLKSGRPILSVPQGGLRAEINRVGIAWDGDDEAARAVAAAEPFLTMANTVDIATVSGSTAERAFPEDLVEYFAWRGVAAEAHVLESNYQTIGARLVEFMDERKWDMVVMGAFGRGRFIERFFAGPTKGVPWKADIPVLQMH
ncbi:MAG: hypothetical protein ACX939_10410, partial [Hyphococcus sp.]